MKFTSGAYNVYMQVSKELLKHLRKESGQENDDILFNLMHTLDKRFTRIDIDKHLKNRPNKPGFGTFKVIDYPGTDIKIKCTIGFNHSNSTFEKKHEIYVKMTHQTGQWLHMNDVDIKKFLKDKEEAITDSILLGSDRSSVEVPSTAEVFRVETRKMKKDLKKKLRALDHLDQQSQPGHTPPAVQITQSSVPPSPGSSAHTSTLPASSSPLDPVADS